MDLLIRTSSLSGWRGASPMQDHAQKGRGAGASTRAGEDDCGHERGRSGKGERHDAS